jgi:hypothetical protein
MDMTRWEYARVAYGTTPTAWFSRDQGDRLVEQARAHFLNQVDRSKSSGWSIVFLEGAKSNPGPMALLGFLGGLGWELVGSVRPSTEVAEMMTLKRPLGG